MKKPRILVIEDDKDIYVGSVGHDAEADVLQVFYDLDKGLVKDFIPSFAVGRDPLGIGLEEQVISRSDIVRLGANEVRLLKDLQDQTGFHRGHTISEIYREFNPLEEYGLRYSEG